MTFALGTRLGPYQIGARIGVGGMGEVYRATDTNLKRSVAIKVLLPSVTGDADRLARFQREAEVLAALNHPNIAAIYGLERGADQTALVMELVEGPTLADRIAAGALPLREALPIARQITDALEAAHEHGIVHRDLKPANIKVTSDGVVKVLDFGLAKIADPPTHSTAGLSQLPTITTPAMTQAGVILGTAAYMSPEQAKGRQADKRTDVWAFACVLYEMLTGRRAFAGEDVAETLAFVLTKDADWNALPSDVPEYLRTLLRRCLEKDRKARVPDIAVVRFQIDEASKGTTDQRTGRAPSGLRRKERMAWAAGLFICAAAGAGFVLRERLSPRGPLPVVRFSFAPPAGGAFPGGSGTPRMAVSPDGRHVAFTVNLRDGTRDQLWVRQIDSIESRPLVAPVTSGGEQVQQPFWSPDSKSIGFFVDGKLRRVDLDGTAEQTICDVPGNNYGGTWGADGTILFSGTGTNGIRRVPATGGTPTQVTSVDAAKGERRHFWPKLLPDGRHFLYMAQGDNAATYATYVGSLDDAVRIKVLNSQFMVEFAEPGWLLFVQGGALAAQRFDLSTFQLTGTLVQVAKTVMGTPANGRVAVSASRVGTLVYAPGLGDGAVDSQLAWLDRGGRELSTVGRPALIRGVELSPDGRRVALHIDETPERGDIWIADLGRNTTQRLTFDPERHNAAPVWSPDGHRVTFSKGTGALGIYEKDAGGVGDEQLVLKAQGPFMTPFSFSPSGIMVLAQATTDRGSDVFALSPNETTPVSIVSGPGMDLAAQVSPDGRWVAYESDQNGRTEVFVQSFPAPKTKLQVSTAGGGRPRWRRDGREIYYFPSADGRPLTAVPVTPNGEGLRLGNPIELFATRVTNASHQIPYFGYAPSPDGQRFLVARPVGAQGSGFEAALTVVINWEAALR